MNKLWPFIYGFLAMCLIACAPYAEKFDEAAWRNQIDNENPADLYAPHFKQGRYYNPWLPMEKKHIGQLLAWRFSRKDAYTEEEKTYLPKYIPDLIGRIQSLPPGDFIAWIGHSTFLIRLQGRYWLTDPMFSQRALLPKRVTPPAVSGIDLQKLSDTVHVLISHNHYDHLDADSIKNLPKNATVYVPAGLSEFVESIFPGKVVELDWWDNIRVGDTHLTCLPAQHWSRRIGQPFNTTLWASFMLVSPSKTVYYGADSGYFIGYKEFARRFPKIDYALLSTTAYHPRWFMHYAHKNIEESIEAFRDLCASYFIPTQWGTFALGDEPPGYPALDLRRYIARHGLDASRFIIMDIGQIVDLEKP